MLSYGGFSVGERNNLVAANATDIESAFDRILRAANGNTDPNVSVSVPPFIDDLELLLENYATRQNAKVSSATSDTY